ncbi:hypothetical protein CXB51_030926 [Gossypium anomalum]|uniref:Cyanobacterial aminoacyl-tRNA synthetase CAAD domain-containing protein n=1 Tax=Gossypium anomalum TaxID=47600 RepID=A0A8J5Y8V0_9ROSI|nr:hypothetical protein CXB51_030926 [Gossypium anomalum]
MSDERDLKRRFADREPTTHNPNLIHVSFSVITVSELANSKSLKRASINCKTGPLKYRICCVWSGHISETAKFHLEMATAASSSSSMVATAVLIPRFPAASVGTTRCSALPPLPPRVSTASLSFSSSVKLIPESKRFSLLQTQASEETSVDAGDLFADLKEKWDKVEDKTTVVLYGGGALVAVWLSSILIGAINSVPLLPKIMELVGVGYTGWFIYRYLLFKSSRKELATDIEALKNKITGTE